MPRQFTAPIHYALPIGRSVEPVLVTEFRVAQHLEDRLACLAIGTAQQARHRCGIERRRRLLVFTGGSRAFGAQQLSTDLGGVHPQGTLDIRQRLCNLGTQPELRIITATRLRQFDAEIR